MGRFNKLKIIWHCPLRVKKEVAISGLRSSSYPKRYQQPQREKSINHSYIISLKIQDCVASVFTVQIRQ